MTIEDTQLKALLLDITDDQFRSEKFWKEEIAYANKRVLRSMVTITAHQEGMSEEFKEKFARDYATYVKHHAERVATYNEKVKQMGAWERAISAWDPPSVLREVKERFFSFVKKRQEALCSGGPLQEENIHDAFDREYVDAFEQLERGVRQFTEAHQGLRKCRQALAALEASPPRVE